MIERWPVLVLLAVVSFLFGFKVLGRWADDPLADFELRRMMS